MREDFLHHNRSWQGQVLQAYRSFRDGRYKETILLLEKNVHVDKGAPYPYFLLAVSYLLDSQIVSADAVMTALRKKYPDYYPLAELDAFLVVKSASSPEEAIVCYMDLAQHYPSKRNLHKMISKIRQADDFGTFQKQIRLADCVKVPKPDHRFAGLFLHRFQSMVKSEKKREGRRYPKAGRLYWKVFMVMIFGVVLLLVGVASFHYFYTGLPETPGKKNSNNSTGNALEYITLDGTKYSLIDKIVRKKTKIFYYNEQDVTSDFKKIKKYMQLEQYNRALVLLNKIDNSNANIAVKEKTAFLKGFIEKTEHKEKKAENIAFEAIVRQPFLYQGVMIEWKGKVSNYDLKSGKTMFSLLIDYKEKDVFAGIADIFCDRKKELKNGDYVTVVGTIKSILENNNRLYVHAWNIYKK